MQKVISCDVDGVLLDIYTPIEQWINSFGYDLDFERDCTTWGMESLGKLRPLVFSAFANSEIRGKAEWYPYAESLLLALCDFASKQGFQLVLNTHESSLSCADIKFNKCKELISRLGVSNIAVNIQTGGHKLPCKNERICIEDSLPNLIDSPAYLKFLIPHRHNSPKTNVMPVNILRLAPQGLIGVFSKGGDHVESRRGLQNIRCAVG